jgi:hypothetical protein
MICRPHRAPSSVLDLLSRSTGRCRSCLSSPAEFKGRVPQPHLRRDWAHLCRIYAGIGPTPVTPATGLRPRLPHLHRGLALRCHICTGTGLTLATRTSTGTADRTEGPARASAGSALQSDSSILRRYKARSCLTSPPAGRTSDRRWWYARCKLAFRIRSRTGLPPRHMCTGTGLPPCHVCTGTGLPPCHIRTGTGLTPATSAPGLGSPCHVCTGTGAHPCHVCTGTGAHPCHICTGTWQGKLGGLRGAR